MAQLIEDLLQSPPETGYKDLDTSGGAGTFTFIPTTDFNDTAVGLENFKKAIFGVGYYFYI